MSVDIEYNSIKSLNYTSLLFAGVPNNRLLAYIKHRKLLTPQDQNPATGLSTDTQTIG